MKTKKGYVHLDQFARDRLEALLKAGMKQKDIADVLKVDKSTVSREVSRRKRRDGRYDAWLAEHKAGILRRNSKYQGMKIEQNPALKKRIIEELRVYRSPDEIAGRMRKEKVRPRADKDAIYKWLYSPFGQRYCRYLCTKRYRRKPQRNTPKRVLIPNKINVSLRPARGIHAEGDTFVSPKKSHSTHSVAAVVLKKEKLLFLRKLPSLRPARMLAAVQDIGSEVRFDTLTLDGGIENRLHEQFGAATYFCDPQSPYQKPNIEQAIGLVRRWFLPKGTNLSIVDQKQLNLYEKILNGKYRKSLGYQSAYEVASKRGILKDITNASCI